LYKFSLLDNTIRIAKFIVTANGEKSLAYDEDKATLMAADRDGTVTAIDPETYADVLWMDGITVPDSTDPYAEAIKIYEMGEATYKARQTLAEKSKNEQLRADLDYVMLMGGL